MLRIGEAVRMTPKDIEDLHFLTGLKPPSITTVREFTAYIEASKARYADDIAEGVLVRNMIDETAGRMLAQNAAAPVTHRFEKPSFLRDVAFSVQAFVLTLYSIVFPKRPPGWKRGPAAATNRAS